MGSTTVAEILELLRRGDLEVVERMPWASNGTFLAVVDAAGAEVPVIYKPQRGERPLWDFPAGTLYRREAAAFVVSEASGWSIVPPTVVRRGPLGEGMIQLFVDHDPDEHYLTLRDDALDRFRRFAAFDVVVNNADRKSGHCLVDADGNVWGIDHGLTFHVAPKLRTVIWDFTGEVVPPDVLDGLRQLDDALAPGGPARDALARLLSDGELDALIVRVQRLSREARFPGPEVDYPYPWPLV